MSTPDTFTPERFVGRTAVVTGAGSGIGRATAIRLAREGATVIAVDLAPDRLDALAAEFPAPGLRTLALNVADADAGERLLEAASGVVDVLVNNAGIMDGFLPVGEVDDATLDRVLAVNVTSMVRIMRAIVPGMRERGGGSIVNVASEAALRGSISGVAYAASKHAVVGITQNSAVLYQPDGIRVNAVAPGAVQTNIEAPFRSQLAGERLGARMGAMLPGMGTSEQLAAAITFLASDDASFINGVTLPVDGGWSAI